MKTHKIFAGLAMVVLALALVFSSCEREIAVSSVELTENKTPLALGESDTLFARIIPSNAANQNVSWSTSNAEIATVNAGVVTAVSVGNVRITVTTEEGRRTAYVDYDVVPRRVPVEGVAIDSVVKTGTTDRINFVMDEDIKTINIVHGDFVTFLQTVFPADMEDATVDRRVRWDSRNSAVVAVNAAGTVTHTAPGTTYIVVTTLEGDFQDSVRVTVEPIRVETVEIQLGGNPVTAHDMRIHHVRTFIAVLTPTPSFSDVEWTIEHLEGVEGEVVNVVNGVVTGVGEGRVYVIATATENGLGSKSARVEITVSGVAVSGITLEPNEIELRVLGTQALTSTIEPADASDQTVTWTSSNTNVATVTNGIVSATGVGTAIITVTTTDGGFEATATVLVAPGAPSECVEDRLEGLITPETRRFYTDETWTLGDLTWSDIVVADVCNKTDYYAGQVPLGLAAGEFMSDCRSGSPLLGVGDDLSFFSWCAVMAHREVLCPYPWRVPTREDFEKLDIHFGGNGTAQRFASNQEHLDIVLRFENEWGARRVGGVVQGAAVPEENVGNGGFGHRHFGTVNTGTTYWQFDFQRPSGTTNAALNGRFAFLLSSATTPDPRGEIRPANSTNANTGGILRCVKDK